MVSDSGRSTPPDGAAPPPAQMRFELMEIEQRLKECITQAFDKAFAPLTAALREQRPNRDAVYRTRAPAAPPYDPAQKQIGGAGNGAPQPHVPPREEEDRKEHFRRPCVADLAPKDVHRLPTAFGARLAPLMADFRALRADVDEIRGMCMRPTSPLAPAQKQLAAANSGANLRPVPPHDVGDTAEDLDLQSAPRGNEVPRGCREIHHDIDGAHERCFCRAGDDYHDRRGHGADLDPSDQNFHTKESSNFAFLGVWLYPTPTSSEIWFSFLLQLPIIHLAIRSWDPGIMSAAMHMFELPFGTHHGWDLMFLGSNQQGPSFEDSILGHDGVCDQSDCAPVAIGCSQMTVVLPMQAPWELGSAFSLSITTGMQLLQLLSRVVLLGVIHSTLWLTDGWSETNSAHNFPCLQSREWRSFLQHGKYTASLILPWNPDGWMASSTTLLFSIGCSFLHWNPGLPEATYSEEQLVLHKLGLCQATGSIFKLLQAKNIVLPLPHAVQQRCLGWLQLHHDIFLLMVEWKHSYFSVRLWDPGIIQFLSRTAVLSPIQADFSSEGTGDTRACTWLLCWHLQFVYRKDETIMWLQLHFFCTFLTWIDLQCSFRVPHILSSALIFGCVLLEPEWCISFTDHNSSCIRGIELEDKLHFKGRKLSCPAYMTHSMLYKVWGQRAV